MEENWTNESIRVQLSELKGARIYQEVFNRAAGQRYQVEVFREQEVLFIPATASIDERGTVTGNQSTRSYEARGSETAGQRTAFIDRATANNSSERLARAVEDRLARNASPSSTLRSEGPTLNL